MAQSVWELKCQWILNDFYLDNTPHEGMSVSMNTNKSFNVCQLFIDIKAIFEWRISFFSFIECMNIFFFAQWRS